MRGVDFLSSTIQGLYFLAKTGGNYSTAQKKPNREREHKSEKKKHNITPHTFFLMLCIFIEHFSQFHYIQCSNHLIHIYLL